MKKFFSPLFMAALGIVCVLLSAHSQTNSYNPIEKKMAVYPCENDLIEVMFEWGSMVRLRNGLLVDLRTDALSGLDEVLVKVKGHTWYRISSIPESEIDAWAEKGSRNSAEPVYNLNNIYRIQIPEEADIWQISRELENLPGILSAKPVPKPVAPPVPPNYIPNQGYLNPATSTPTGIDASYAWTQTGGTGTGITICDLEYSWNYNHADISKAAGSQINTNVVDPFNDNNHGTAVIGELVADNNGWGITGICYGANLLTCGTNYGSPVTWNVPGAITLAISNLNAGDIILLEQQWDYNGSAGYVPIEWWTNGSSQTYNAVYAAIVNAVSNGIHVVEAGGNGNINTDGLTWYGNSGAIIVGAGGTSAANDLQKLSFSSYGSRFDLQGWGENVFTTGYGNYYNAEGVNYWYTHNFNGTSSASPVVAGALACAEGYYLANVSSTPPTPSYMRTHLVNYGTAQVTPPSGNIGPRPDLYAAINNFPPPAQYYDWGDAPDPPHPTLSASAGANHQIVAGIMLGASVDTENDGQPNPGATGDDNDGNNDDDGIVFTSILRPGATVIITATASVTGYLNGWIDFNGMNTWSDPGEHCIINMLIVPGPNSVSFNVPASALIGPTYARFRFNTQGGLGFVGPASDGEVEDYAVFIDEPLPDNLDWGDAPDPTYPTLGANNGANHLIDGITFMGAVVDPEPDGQPDPAALGDDNDLIYPPPNDDEDGVIFTSSIIPGQMASVDVIASVNGILNAWLDFNGNGTWADPGDHIFADIPLIPGLNSLSFPVPAGIGSGNTFTRFRFSTAPGLNFNGPAQDGEVEDYEVNIEEQQEDEFDWGDAPDPTYPTFGANNGPNHWIDGITYMGNSVDGEPDGQPDPNALGDDNDGNNDNDGVIFTSAIIPGQIATVDVIASVPGLLNAWMDFNINGSWADAGEQIFIDWMLNPGLNNLTFNVPASAISGNSFCRFRFSNMAGLNFDGPAPDGEVEDYEMNIGTSITDIQIDPDPGGNFVQNEISMALVPGTTAGIPAVLLAAYNDTPYPGGPGLGVSYSHDGGATWNPLQLPYPVNPGGTAYADMFDPTATADGNGNLYVAHISTDYDWTNGPESGLFVHKSTDGGITWNPPVTVAYDGKPTVSPDPNYRFNDRCQMTADITPASPFYNNLYLVEIKDRGWNMPQPLSDIYFSRSTDGGLTWSSQVILNNNTSMGNMPVPAVASDGTLYVCWIDYNVQTGGTGTLYLDVSPDGGVTWLPNDILVTTINLPPLNLNGGTDVLAKGAAVIEVSPFNPQEVYITYGEQIAGSMDEGDIYFIRSTDGGFTWTMPLMINDDGTMNDQIMPWMDVKPNGMIDIAWYDRRNDPADLKWDVYMAVSMNGGIGFNPNVMVNSVAAPSPNTPSGIWMGEYLGLVVDNTHAYVGFTSSILDINGDVFFNKFQNPAIDIDFGDAPDPTYPTLLVNNGARHMLGSGLCLGAQVDSEPDGQPDPNALGDDNTNLADEDGVVFNWPLMTGNPVDLTVTTSAFGLFSGWIDFNGDGDWSDMGEQVFMDMPLNSGTHNLNFIVPINAATGLSFARFRISTQPALSYDGSALDGEVEDYEVEIMEDPDIKWQQYPETNLPGLHAHDWDYTGQIESLVLADDWLCQGGVVTDIHWWGNYELDPASQEIRGAGIDHFHLSIHANDPTNCLPLDPELYGVDIPFSTLVEQNTGLVNLEGCNIYLYEFILTDPFIQEEGTRYWLDITAVSVDPLNPAIWRWQESRRSIMPILCGAADKQLPNPGTWTTITWANQKFSDMAFIITSVEFEPEYDFGDAPDPTYPTLLVNNGARHMLGSGLCLGAQVDSEPDGQPDPNALGDDNTNLADEDGVVFNWPLMTGNPVDLTVTTSAFGLFSGWIDFNGDGDWSDMGEQVFMDMPLNSGTHNLNFIVPINAATGLSFARFRISTQPALSYDGSALDGEVEDYEVEIMEDPDIKWQQYPETNLPGLHAHDWDYTGQVESLILADDWLCQGGIVTDIHWWGNYELDVASQEKRGAGISHFHISIHANDPTNCLPLDPELYGIDIPFSTLVEQNTGLVNLEGCNIYLYEFILTDPFIQEEGTRYWLDITAVSVDPLNPAIWRWQESRRSIMPILCGAADKQLPNPGTWTTITWANQKFSDMAFIITSVEFEPEYDFGDAPDPTYPTLLASNGAVHQIDATIYLGAGIDPEPDGQPSAQALGDDNDGNDDEDGITFSTLSPSGSVFINLTASANGFLNAWIDYNGNGSWSDPGEQIFTDQTIVPGMNGFIIPVPPNAKIGITYARFRYSTLAGLSFTGPAPDGEVEDYEIIIEGDVEVDLKAFLKGPFMTSSMSTDLNDAGLLPLNQPYNSDPTAIWYYGGSESVSSIPGASITDWVVVEFRDALSAPLADPSTTVSKQAAFVLSNGTIVSLDGVSPVRVNGLYQHNLYVVIWHRNHLPMMSSTPINPAGINQYSYDFTTSAGQAYLNGQTALGGGGMYGMIGGDGDPNGTIDNNDKSNVWATQAGTSGYLMGDLNMDTVVDNQDKNNIWYPNTGAGTQVP
ncbi:MAG: S8 family serine peptidase [Bacteroidetes bacterium]|nr:S8 family serine peptidase [Bacteroidota bacterium]